VSEKRIAITRKKDFFFVSGILVISVIISLPFIQSKVISENNFSSYLPALIEFHKNIKNWILMPKWSPDFGSGYGLPFFIFNPPLFYYVSEVFHLIGYDFINSMNLSCFLLNILSGLFMYLLAKELLGKTSGFVSSALYILCPYILTALNVKYDFAELSSLPLLPVTALSFYKLSFAEKNYWKYFFSGALSLALLLLSHIKTSFIFLILLLLCIPVLTIYFNKKLNSFTACAGSFFTGLLLSAFFWIPALLEKKYVRFAETPWRFSILVSFVCTLFFACLFDLLIIKFHKLKYLFIIILIILMFALFPLLTKEFSYSDFNEKDFSPKKIASKGIFVISKKEYEPIWVREKSDKSPETRFTTIKGNVQLFYYMQGNKKIIVEKINPVQYSFRVNSLEDSKLRINIHYFPGWRAYIKEPRTLYKFEEVKIDCSNKYGLMDINVPSGYPEFEIRFENTSLREFSNILSFIGILALYFVYLFSKVYPPDHQPRTGKTGN